MQKIDNTRGKEGKKHWKQKMPKNKSSFLFFSAIVKHLLSPRQSSLEWKLFGKHGKVLLVFFQSHNILSGIFSAKREKRMSGKKKLN